MHSPRGTPTDIKLTDPHNHAPLSSSTPAGELSSHSSSTNTNVSRLDAKTEPAGQEAGAPGATKRIAAAQRASTAEREREYNLQAEEPTAEDHTSLETVLPTPPANTTSQNNSQTTTSETSESSEVTSDDAPLESSLLIGVTNILIPVSTPKLFFQRFDMLQTQMDELKSLVGRNPSERTMTTASAPAEVDGENVLTERVLALKRLILTQNKNLLNVQNNCDLLLSDNSELKNIINLILKNTEYLQSAHSKLVLINIAGPI